MKDNVEVNVLFFEGRPIGVDLPITVDLLVTHCEPGIKGDTATGATKPSHPGKPATWCRCPCSWKKATC